MLLSPSDSLTEMHEKVQLEFVKALNSKKHPFRYLVFGTALNQAPDLRYVVLRHLTQDKKLVIFTDVRSKKIEAIRENNQVSLLFYHPRKKLQVKVLGSAEIITQGPYFEYSKQKVQGDAYKAYSTDIAPSTSIKNWEEGHRFSPENKLNYFCVITVEPTAFDVLQLDRDNHIRYSATKKRADFELGYLVP
ncbi:MAG: pyridoxamine 5'-phosphate oxidase family protein [Luteibaculaceae bacterium]